MRRRLPERLGCERGGLDPVAAAHPFYDDRGLLLPEKTIARYELNRKLSRLVYRRGCNPRAIYSFLRNHLSQLPNLEPEIFAALIGRHLPPHF